MTDKFVFDNFASGEVIEHLDMERALQLTNDYVRHSLEKTPKDIREITSHLSGAMGKGVRAKLLLTCAMDKNGKIPSTAVSVAAGIELFHLATLIHDDVIDDSPLRRGIPTVQSRFGKKQAVICGDYILCIAMSIIADAAKPYSGDEDRASLYPEFLNAAKSICVGEYSQGANVGNLDITYREYLKIISGKTAALFYISAYAGALLCEDLSVRENERQVQSLAKYGKYLGVIFQIIDDCKDYEFTEKDAKKPVQRDIAGGIVTLPLIMSIAKDKKVRNLATSAMKDAVHTSALIDEVRADGGVKKAKDIAGKYVQKARHCLDNAMANETKKQLLSSILDNVYASANSF